MALWTYGLRDLDPLDYIRLLYDLGHLIMIIPVYLIYSRTTMHILMDPVVFWLPFVFLSLLSLGRLILFPYTPLCWPSIVPLWPFLLSLL